MRIGPIFLVSLICLWLLLAAIGWAVAGAGADRGPRLAALPVALVAGLAAAFALGGIGLRGGGGLVLSLLIAPALGLLVGAVLAH